MNISGAYTQEKIYVTPLSSFNILLATLLMWGGAYTFLGYSQLSVHLNWHQATCKFCLHFLLCHTLRITTSCCSLQVTNISMNMRNTCNILIISYMHKPPYDISVQGSLQFFFKKNGDYNQLKTNTTNKNKINDCPKNKLDSEYKNKKQKPPFSQVCWNKGCLFFVSFIEGQRL